MLKILEEVFHRAPAHRQVVPPVDNVENNNLGLVGADLLEHPMFYGKMDRVFGLSET